MPAAEPNITSSRTYAFTFAVTAFTNQEVTCTLAPTITGAAGWTAVLDGASQITILANGRREVRVRVTVPAGQGTGITGALRLTVTENTPGTLVTPGNAQIPIVVGSPPPTPELRVRITVRSATNAASLVGTGVQFNRAANNGNGSIQFSIALTEGGAYTVEGQMRETTGWTNRGIDVPSFTAADPTGGATTNQLINAGFIAGATAVSTELLLTVRRGTDITIQYALPITVV
jgi:hypothetical protein